MNHYDFEMGVCPKPPVKKQHHTHTATTGNTTDTGGVVRRRTPSAGGNVSERYEAAIAAYGSGATWDETITYWGTALYSTGYDLSEMDECAVDDSFIDEIADKIRTDVDERGAGVRQNRIADVRRGVVTALRKMIFRAREWRDNGGKTFTPRAKATQPPQHALHVRNLIGNMGDCDLDAVRELSPCLDWIGQPERTQTALFVRAAFAPGEMVHVFRDDVPTIGTPGVNIRPAADWVQAVERDKPLPGDLIVPNPFTGEQGTTTAGKQSYIAQSCLAAFPFMVLEFDDMPLPKQCAFWRAFILTSNLAPALVALTYSGNRSIHGLVHVGCAAIADWQAVRQHMRALFASDTNAIMRADDQAMHPRTGTRLPGVRRFGNHALQELVYLNPNARAGTMWREPIAQPPPIDTNGKPPCGTAFGKSMCGVCVRLPDCPFADADAVPNTTMKGGAKC